MSTTNGKPTTNMARDLLLLATVAYRGRKYDNAGALFAAAMSSEGAQELIEELETVSGLPHSEEELSALSSASGDDGMSLSEIISSLSAAMEAEDEDDSDDIDVEDDAVIDNESGVDGLPLPEGVYEEDDGDSEDPDPDSPGQMILPSSISSVSLDDKDGDAEEIDPTDGEDSAPKPPKVDDRELKHRPSTIEVDDEEPSDEANASDPVSDVNVTLPAAAAAAEDVNTGDQDRPEFVSVLASSPVSLL